jgi:hypothetical protein
VLTTHDDLVGKQSLSLLALEHCHLAVQQLREAVARPDFDPTEGHILTIALLGCLSWRPREGEEPYSRSPMADLQHVHEFSTFETTLPHINAVYRTVEMRGGLERIKSPSLVSILKL